MRKLGELVFLAVVSITLATLSHPAKAQTPDGLTGNPLIDSILQAPGPDEFITRPMSERYMRAPRRPREDFPDPYEDRQLPPQRETRAAPPPPPPPLPAARGEAPAPRRVARKPKRPAQPAPPARSPDKPVQTAAVPATRAATVDTPARKADETDRMIGQMLLVGFSGKTVNARGVKHVAAQLRQGIIGGVIFMSHNVTSPKQVAQLTRFFRKAAGDKMTPFLAIDQEGGYVQRLTRKKGFSAYPSAGRLGEKNDPEGAYETYRAMADELAHYGFNVNFGPVVDLNLNPRNPVIGRLRRSFGKDPKHVSSYARAFIYAHHDAGVLTALKHFPGHGSSTTDSHKQLVDITRSWRDEELAPYRELIGSGQVDMIMIAHLYHPQFSDGKTRPTSLSRQTIGKLLRERLDYSGVVITDDLEMAAVRKHTSFEERLVQAVRAGNDILLLSNTAKYTPDLPERAIGVLRGAIKRGEISLERIRASYQRITALKNKLKKLQQANKRAATPSRQKRQRLTTGG